MIGQSVKSLERLAAQGAIQSGQRPVAGRKPATVYHPDDIARIAAERTPKSYVMPQGHGLATVPDKAIVPLFEAILAGLTPHAAQDATPQPKPFLTITEAAAYTGLSKSYIRSSIQVAAEGTAPLLASIRDGRTHKIRRRDLDSL